MAWNLMHDQMLYQHMRKQLCVSNFIQTIGPGYCYSDYMNFKQKKKGKDAGSGHCMFPHTFS